MMSRRDLALDVLDADELAGLRFGNCGFVMVASGCSCGLPVYNWIISFRV